MQYFTMFYKILQLIKPHLKFLFTFLQDFNTFKWAYSSFSSGNRLRYMSISTITDMNENTCITMVPSEYQWSCYIRWSDMLIVDTLKVWDSWKQIQGVPFPVLALVDEVFFIAVICTISHKLFSAVWIGEQNVSHITNLPSCFRSKTMTLTIQA